MVASQMANALFETTTAEIEAGGAASGTVYLFQAEGVVQKFAGFLALYTEGTDAEDEDEAGALPPLDAGEGLDLAKPLEAQQKFTQPPPRYTEASLVKALEENGIGRPSTYAAILSTIQERGYVTKDAGALKPEPLGLMVDDLLKASFPDVVNLQFTARMEEGLDEIAEGKKEWVAFLSDFYGPFQSAVEKATAEACDKCGKPMAIKDGRFGPFLACTGYPECRNAKPIRKKASEPSGELCDKCGKPMVIKEGRYGSFLGCSGYPECRNLKAILVKVGVLCPSPDCGGELVEKTYKKARAVKRFYGCSNYPKCDFATSLKPISEPCPKCSGLLTAFRSGGVKCTRCDYKGRPPRKRPGDQAEAEPEAVAAGG
jgi:DNA topoisomerase-1